MYQSLPPFVCPYGGLFEEGFLMDPKHFGQYLTHKRSIPSLGAGLIFGSILGLGAYQISRDPTNYQLMLGTTTVLGGLMGYRFYNSRKFMPAGLVFVLSVGMLAKILTKNVGSSAMPIKSG